MARRRREIFEDNVPLEVIFNRKSSNQMSGFEKNPRVFLWEPSKAFGVAEILPRRQGHLRRPSLAIWAPAAPQSLKCCDFERLRRSKLLRVAIWAPAAPKSLKCYSDSGKSLKCYYPQKLWVIPTKKTLHQSDFICLLLCFMMKQTKFLHLHGVFVSFFVNFTKFIKIPMIFIDFLMKIAAVGVRTSPRSMKIIGISIKIHAFM